MLTRVQGTITGDTYQVSHDHFVGRGSFGNVSKCFEITSLRAYVIKIISSTDTSKENFFKEIKVLEST